MQNNILIKPLILAAGLGSRMQIPKIFMSFKDKYFLDMITESIYSIFAEPLIIIRKEFEDDFKKTFPKNNEYLINKNPENGMFSSVLIGINYIKSSHICIIPIDHPFVNADTYIRLKDNTYMNPNSIIKPTHKNIPGHPIIIPNKIKNFINPEIQSLNQLTKTSSLNTIYLEVEDRTILKNINTIKDLTDEKHI